MIDLHSHILPGVDDGAADISVSLAMAKMAVSDGTTVMACTPHFMPGVYDTTASMLDDAIARLSQSLTEHSVPLKLVRGGDVHVSPDLPEKLENRTVPTIGQSRYFLFEPPHHVAPPNLVKLCKQLLEVGYVPILTHPERLTWIEKRYDLVCELDEMGVPQQLTAKSVTGDFGKRPKYWSDRMLDEGRVDLIASDAHNITSRPPGLARAFDKVGERLGEETAERMFLANPELVLQDRPLIEKPARNKLEKKASKRGLLRSLLSGKHQ